MIMIRYFYIIHYHPRYPISALIVLLLIISSIEAQSSDESLVTDSTTTAAPKKLTPINDSVITTSSESSLSLSTASASQNKYDIINEKSNQSVSRPSNILKQLWSSASQSYNSSDDELIKIVVTSDDNNRNTTATSSGSSSGGGGSSVSKKLISAPIKWSSEIVPSVPLQLQLPSKAIFLPHFLTNEEIRKSSPNGDITVINGNDKEEATPVTYEQRNFADQYRPQWLGQQQQQRSDVSKSLTPLMTSELIANSSQNCTQQVTTTAIENDIASINDQISKINNLTYNAFVTRRVVENRTEPDVTSKITNESVITTSEPIVTRRTAALEFTTTAIKKSTEYSLPRSTQTLEERRRAAINSKFGIRLTPPRSSVDTFLSIFKPTHIAYNSEWNGSRARKWPNFFPRTTKSPQQQRQQTSHKTSNAYAIKPHVSAHNTFISRSNNMHKQMQDLLPMASEMRVESRQVFTATPLIFPSRQTPNLRPKIVATTATTNSNNNNYYRNYGNQPTVSDLKENWANILKSRREMFLNNINNNKFEKRSEDTTTMMAKTTELNVDKEMFNESKLTTDNNNKNSNQNIVAYTEISTQPIEINPEISTYPDIDNEAEMSVFHNRKIPVYYEEYSVPGHLLIPEPELYSHETVEHHQENFDDQLYIPPDIYLQEKEVTPDPNILPNPDLFKHELSKPKTAPKFSLRPIDPQYFQKLKDSKDPATLPNKMQAMQELISALSSVKKSISKLNPIGKHMASMYKGFVSRVKASIKSNKGPYANYYPPGDFDEEYDGEEVEHRSSASEINATFVQPPDGYNSTFGENFTDADAEDYVRKSFGYRVTIYKSPDSLNPNITEELITDDDAEAIDDNDYEELESDASDESPVTDTKSKLFTKQVHDTDIMGEKHGKMKGKGKILDLDKNRLEKDRASKAREHKSALKLQKVDTHKRKHSNERALKERTTIEFFEREQISDTHKHHDNELFGAKDIQTLGTETNNSVKIPHPDGGDSERNIRKDRENQTSDHNNSDDSNYYRSESSNPQQFSIKFPNAKTKHSDDAHKYKGWRERGYKIITETEFVDRGNKLDTGFKKQEKGNVAHTKEHNAKDLTRGEKAKYYKNVKEMNKSFDAQYGNRVKQNDFKGYDKEEELPQHSPLQSSPRDNYAKIRIVSHDVNKNTAPYGYRLSSITSEQYPYPHTETEAHLKDITESDIDAEVPADSTSHRLRPALPTASSDSTYSIEPTADNALSLKATTVYEPTYNSLADPNPTSSSSDVSPQSIISREPELSSNYFHREEEEEEYESTPISNSNKNNNYYNSDDTYHEESGDKKSANSGNNNNNNDESDAHLDNSSSSNDQIEPAITYHKQIDHSSHKTTSIRSSSTTGDPHNNNDSNDNRNDTLSYSLSNPNQLNDASDYENIDDNKPSPEEEEDNSRRYYNDYKQKDDSNDYETYPPTNSYNNNENYYYTNPKNNANHETKFYSLSQYLNDQNPQFFNNTMNNSDKKPTEYIIKPSYYYRNRYNDSYGTTATTVQANNNDNNNNNEYSAPKQYEPTIGNQLSNEMQITTNPYYDYPTFFTKNNYDFPSDEYFNQKTVPTMTSEKEKTETPFIESPFVYNSNDIENIHNIYNEAIQLQDAPDLSPHGFTSLPATTTTTAKAKNLNTKYLNAAAVTASNGISMDLGRSLGSKRQNSDININNKKTRIKLRYKNNNGFAPNYRLTPASPLTIPPLITANQNLYLASNIPQHFFHTAYSSPQAVHYDIRIPLPMTGAQQMPTTTTTRLPLFVRTNAPTFLYGPQAMPFSASDTRPVAVLHRNKFVSITTPAMLKSRAHHHLSSNNMWTNIDPLFRKLSPLRWRLNGIRNPINNYGFSKKHSAVVPTPKSLPKIIKEKLVKSSSNAGTNKNGDTKSIFNKLFSFR